MKKKEQEIAVNRSSGAEKVEVIEKERKTTGGVKKTKRVTATAKGDAALGDSAREKVDAKKMNGEMSGGPAEQESVAAKERVERALKKKEERAKRKAERAKKIAEKKAELQKQIAEVKAEQEKWLAERKALQEERKKARAEA